MSAVPLTPKNLPFDPQTAIAIVAMKYAFDVLDFRTPVVHADVGPTTREGRCDADADCVVLELPVIQPEFHLKCRIDATPLAGGKFRCLAR